MTRSRQRKFQFSKALVGRLVAVALFVCLGTFAVVQSINGTRKAKNNDGAIAGAENAEQENTDEHASVPPIAGSLSDENVSQFPAKPASFSSVPNERENIPTLPAENAPVVTTNQFPDSPPTNTLPKQELPPLINSTPKKVEIGDQQELPGGFNPGNQFGSTGGTQGNSLPKTTTPSFSMPPLNNSVPAAPPRTNSFSGNSNPPDTNRPNTNLPNINLPDTNLPGRNLPNNNLSNSTTLPNADPFNTRPPTAPPTNNDNNDQFALPRVIPNTVNPPQTGTLPNVVDNLKNNVNEFQNKLDTLNPIAPQKTGINSNPDALPQTSFQPIPPGQDKRPQEMTSNLQTIPQADPPGQNNNPPFADNNLAIPRTQTPAAPISFPKTQMTTPPPTNISAATSDPKVEGIQSPSLTLQKIAPREIQVNQPAEFVLVVRNVGRTTADNVTVYDRVPESTEVVSIEPQPASRSADSLSWNLGSLAPGQQKMIKLKLKPTAPGEIGTVAQVTFTARASARTKITKPVLDLRHSAPEKTLIGRDVLMDIIVENKGDGPAKNVVIQETVPANLQYQVGNREEKEIEYAIGNLMPGQKRNLKLRLRARQVGKVRNLMVAHADGDLKAQHAIDMEIIAPTIGVLADGPGRRFLGRPAVQKFTVKNTGTAAATNVDLVAKLPRGMKFVNANHQGQYNPASHSVIWSLDRLEPGVMGTVELTSTPVQNGNQTVEFTATADLNQRESTETTILVYQIAELHFEIDDVTDALEVGNETIYNVRVVNQGNKAANNVRLQVDFPAGIRPTQVDGKPLAATSGQSVKLAELPTLGPKQERRFTIRAKGVTPGDHRIVASLASDERNIAVKKEESTQVYSDR